LSVQSALPIVLTTTAVATLRWRELMQTS
jgi:hypothetical protein